MSRCVCLASLALLAWASPARAQGDEEHSDRSRINIVPLPVLAYSPETELVLGVAAITVFHPEQPRFRDTQLKTVATYSTNNTAAIELGLESFLSEDRIFLGSELELERAPSTFYGIGNATRLDDGEDYTENTLRLELKPMYAAVERLYVGPFIKLDLYELDEREADGLLDTRAVVGAHSGRDLGLGAAARYDTRDNAVNPRSGYRVSASVRAHHRATGSEFAYERYAVEGRTYLRTWQAQVLALGASVDGLRGRVPYFNLSKLGGWRMLRGHGEGRYRDKVRVVLQSEYRVPIVWRLGAVAFGGVGDVGSGISDLLSHSLKLSVGGGLRLMLDRDARVNLAIDFGYAGDQTGFYIELGEAF